MSKKEPAKFTDLSVARQKVELEKAMLDLQEKDELCIPINEAQATIRTDMEFSVAETRYILECLHTFKEISKETYQLSETDDDAASADIAAEEFAAFIAVVEKAKSLSENGKYVIPMTFWEMDAFLSAFEIERETFDLWNKTELRQRKKYVDVVTDIDERFKPVYNQRRDGVMPIFAQLSDEDAVEDDFDFDFSSIPPIESELEKEIDIKLAIADTPNILTCLTRSQKFAEAKAVDECTDDNDDDNDDDDDTISTYLESTATLGKVNEKIRAAMAARKSKTYAVRLTFGELDRLLGALEGEIDMKSVETEVEIRSKKKYYDTLATVFDRIQPARTARYKAIWPNGDRQNQNS